MALADEDGFARSRAQFEEMLGSLYEHETAKLDHAELEDRLDAEGRELLRLLYQDHLDLRAAREQRLDEIVDANGLSRPSVEASHARALTTIFGEVTVTRLAYRRRSQPNLHPADGVLNLPDERHSHGVRRLAATEAARGSFDDATEAIRSGAPPPLPANARWSSWRPAPQRTSRRSTPVGPGPKRAPRRWWSSPSTARASSCGPAPCAAPPHPPPSGPPPSSRLGCPKAMKRNRKRMAEVGAVYTAVPVTRGADDVIASASQDDRGAKAAPVAKDKWLTASVVDNAASVVGRVFDEAERRDPAHRCAWVALVDGNNHQIDRIRAEAANRGVKVSIVVDLIHVLEYLWRAAWSFYVEGDPAAEAWVRAKAIDILRGRASIVAASIRRKATCLGLGEDERAGADRCANYLLNKAPYLDYATALTNGWPIATGVIEGACRHLVKDRMDITGARWGLDGAEAVLKLRALRCNGDFDAYWRFHLHQERRRMHQSRYASGVIPAAA